MPEFLTLLPPKDALEKVFKHLKTYPGTETISTENAFGRVTAKKVTAPHPLPEFPRSTVDGYAVKASDTFGASYSLPAYLHLIGEILMGEASRITLGKGQCALIHTGGMVPEGSDGIVMVEYTQQMSDNEIEVLRPAAVGENVIEVGEDIKSGEVVFSPGLRLKPADIGGLMALGFTQVEVVRKPIVGIISSGDEVIHPGQNPIPGQVRDVNAYTLKALVEESGGEVILYGIIPDTEEEMVKAALIGKDQCDIVVITAGSSASTRDLTSIVINQLGEPGVLVHGVNVRPGKPTILAICEGKAIIGLPGNPVSALVIAGLFVVPVIKHLLGEDTEKPRGLIKAKLTINLSSQAGREDWVPVKLEKDEGVYLATPIFGRSNLIFTLARADGLIKIEATATGLGAGEFVDVYLT